MSESLMPFSPSCQSAGSTASTNPHQNVRKRIKTPVTICRNMISLKSLRLFSRRYELLKLPCPSIEDFGACPPLRNVRCGETLFIKNLPGSFEKHKGAALVRTLAL